MWRNQGLLIIGETRRYDTNFREIFFFFFLFLFLLFFWVAAFPTGLVSVIDRHVDLILVCCFLSSFGLTARTHIFQVDPLDFL